MSKVWFVTGASRGIGAAIAKVALAAGHRVIATGRTPEKIAQALDSDSDRLLALPLEVTDRQQVQRTVDAAVERFGAIDVLVNNAGYGQLGYFEEIAPEAAERQFAVNVHGLFDVTRAVLPIMREQRSGHIFNISSVGGIAGGNSPHCIAPASSQWRALPSLWRRKWRDSASRSRSLSQVISVRISWMLRPFVMATFPSTITRPIRSDCSLASVRTATSRRAIRPSSPPACSNWRALSPHPCASPPARTPCRW